MMVVQSWRTASKTWNIPRTLDSPGIARATATCHSHPSGMDKGPAHFHSITSCPAPLALNVNFPLSVIFLTNGDDLYKRIPDLFSGHFCSSTLHIPNRTEGYPAADESTAQSLLLRVYSRSLHQDFLGLIALYKVRSRDNISSQIPSWQWAGLSDFYWLQPGQPAVLWSVLDLILHIQLYPVKLISLTTLRGGFGPSHKF